MTCTDLCTDLLPPQAPLQIETMAMTERGMTLDVAVTTSQALCPTWPRRSKGTIIAHVPYSSQYYRKAFCVSSLFRRLK